MLGSLLLLSPKRYRPLKGTTYYYVQISMFCIDTIDAKHRTSIHVYIDDFIKCIVQHLMLDLKNIYKYN